MDYRLVALDLDGTLLNNAGTISAYNQDILSRCRREGLLITLATGRIYASALPFARQLALNDVPLITSHGALVRYTDGPVVAYYPLRENLAAEIFAYLSPHYPDIRFYTEDSLYLSQFSPQALAYAHHIGITPKPLPTHITALHPTKMAIVDTADRIADCETTLKNLYGTQTYITKVSDNFLEVSHPQSTKGLALAALADSLHITAEQVIAIGDSYNDLPMLQYAGCPVAMGNANATIQDVCPYHTATNEQDGVGRFLAGLLS